MPTLEELWIQSGQKRAFKVRYRDWNYRWKHFVIEGYDPSGRYLVGKLDTGEPVQYLADSENWKVYEIGDEEAARAV